MSWNKTILILILLFAGCSIKQPQSRSCCPKLFEGEDRLTMSALYLRQIGDYQDSTKLFHTLYDKTKRVEYRIEEIKNLIVLKDLKKAQNEALALLKEYPNSLELLRITSYLYLLQKDLKNAKKYMLKAIKLSKSPQDYEFLASIYMSEKKYDLALKYYQSAYAIKKSDEIVDKMATIMFLYLNRKSEAISYLETHSRIFGCSKVVCLKLASFYAAINDINSLLNVYQRLYKRYQDDVFGIKIVQIYIYQKKYEDAISFLEKNRLNDELLLELYELTKEYKKASKLALSLYQKSKKLDFLAKSAMFEFESSKVKDKKLLKDVSNKLEKVLEKDKNAIYLNYLGYLYIDYDLDIDRGIKLIKDALKQEPNSPYYLDSLAWGYYKKQKCKEAYKIIKRVVKKLGLNDKEVKFHYEKIKECLKRGKN